MKQNKISEKAKKCWQIYKTDIDYDEFEHELSHFRSLLISKYNEEKFTAFKRLVIIYKNDFVGVSKHRNNFENLYFNTCH
jgi:hypothetical protein